MTNAAGNLEEKSAADNSATESETPQGPPIWLRATSADLVDLDFEAPIIGSQSADSNELGQRFRATAENAGTDPHAPSACSRP
jgi:hypothetical protein